MNRRNIICYISGPYRGTSAWDIAQNIRRAEATALEVWKLGLTAICPHLNTAHFQGVLPDDAWLEGDLAILSRCDAILMMPQWQYSKGAVAEHDYAMDRGIPVFSSLMELEFWASTPRKPDPEMVEVWSEPHWVNITPTGEPTI